ncbi:MAG: TSUP family transporter, partial [Candidatus Limnocylindrales bacterium]
MTPGSEIGIFAISVAAGLIGALAGVGGGILIVPALTIVFGVDIHLAVGASIVSVIATSSGAARSGAKIIGLWNRFSISTRYR